MQSLSTDSFDVSIHAQAVLKLTEDSVYRRFPDVYSEPSGKTDHPALTEESDDVTENNENTVNIYPNPFKGEFIIEYVFNKEISNLQVEIFDIYGRLIQTDNVRNVKIGRVTVQMQKKSKGVYLCRISSPDLILHQQKIIQLND